MGWCRCGVTSERMKRWNKTSTGWEAQEEKKKKGKRLSVIITNPAAAEMLIFSTPSMPLCLGDRGAMTWGMRDGTTLLNAYLWPGALPAEPWGRTSWKHTRQLALIKRELPRNHQCHAYGRDRGTFFSLCCLDLELIFLKVWTVVVFFLYFFSWVNCCTETYP